MVMRARGGNNIAFISSLSINDLVSDFISEAERRANFNQKLKEEDANEEVCMWMSFADKNKQEGHRFIGVIVIKTKGLAHAIKKTHEMGINPGGEIYSCVTDENSILSEHFNRLLSKDELIEYGYINGNS